MTAEQFDRRSWSLKDKVVYRDMVYSIKAINWDCGTVTVSDGLRPSITVCYEAITIYKEK